MFGCLQDEFKASTGASLSTTPPRRSRRRSVAWEMTPQSPTSLLELKEDSPERPTPRDTLSSRESSGSLVSRSYWDAAFIWSPERERRSRPLTIVRRTEDSPSGEAFPSPSRESGPIFSSLRRSLTPEPQSPMSPTSTSQSGWFIGDPLTPTSNLSGPRDHDPDCECMFCMDLQELESPGSATLSFPSYPMFSTPRYSGLTDMMEDRSSYLTTLDRTESPETLSFDCWTSTRSRSPSREDSLFGTQQRSLSPAMKRLRGDSPENKTPSYADFIKYSTLTPQSISETMQLSPIGEPDLLQENEDMNKIVSLDMTNNLFE